MRPSKGGWVEKDVDDVIARDDPDEVLYAPIAVGMHADAVDQMWAEAICLKLVTHTNFNVRGDALLGLGHIGRICGSVKSEQVVPAISRGLEDSHAFVRGQAEGAASELDMHCGIAVPGYDGAQSCEIQDTIASL